MPKPAAEKPRGAAVPVTPIQKGSLTMRKRNFNINVRVTEGEKKRLKKSRKALWNFALGVSEKGRFEQKADRKTEPKAL